MLKAKSPLRSSVPRVCDSLHYSSAAIFTTGLFPKTIYSAKSNRSLTSLLSQTWADSTTVNHDYSNPWQDIVTNERGYKKGYSFDAFSRLTRVQEYDGSQAVYSTTTYKYDVLGNLTEVKDNAINTTTIAYNWLSRKTGMTDPDMGTWSYAYASNGNLIRQTDAKSQTINFAYDALNRLTGKSYSTGMASVTYSYDSTSGGNYGKGRRTGMSDGSGTLAYKYDSRGRIIQETRTVDSIPYTTTYAWDGASRITAVTYPTGEVATQGYNGRGLPYSLGSSVSGTIVSGMQYNSLGLPTQIDLGNNTRTTWGYWDMGGTYDNPGNYYSKLWRIKTVKDPAGTPTTLQEVRHTWDAAGNLTIRENVKDSETENFSYDFLDRLTSATGPYTESYAYNQIGNMTSKAGQSYTYGSSRPHAVTSVGSTNYIYDANGNMNTRGAASLTWDAENRLTGITGGASAAYVYDGNGFRVKKIENNETILYVNQYYEKDLTSATVTLYYYLGGKMAAYKAGASVTYVHQDHLTGTSLTTNDSGTEIGTIRYMPFGAARSFSGTLPAQRFTGQRLDDVGLYYYGARYYDPNLVRFISADTFVQWTAGFNQVSLPLTVNAVPLGLGSVREPRGNYPSFTIQAPLDPQALNRYSYTFNSPLTYTDPYGWWTFGFGFNLNVGLGKGFTVSIMGAFDTRGGLLVFVTQGSGVYYGDGTSITTQVQITNADKVTDLLGESTVVGQSVTVGPTTPLFGIVNAGVAGTSETIIGSNYSGINVGIGLVLLR